MAKLRALVVDDASFVRDLVKRAVRAQFPGMELDEAADGRKAQSLMSRNYYDLVLCDWEMPEVSGLEVLRWMRRHDVYHNKPFIMVTSRGDKEHVVEAIREGVTDYLGKPFSPDSLGKKIRKVMGSRIEGAEKEGAEAGKDAFRQSADLLSGGRKAGKGNGDEASTPAEQRTAAPSDKKAAGSASEKKASSAHKADIRFSGSSLNCVIKAVTLQEIRVTFARSEQAPTILEQAVVDIDLGEGKVARLNGYVYAMQAAEVRQDTEFVNLTIRFVDDDPQKLEDLSHFIARFH